MTETVVRVIALVSQSYEGRAYRVGEEFDMRDTDVREALKHGYVRLVSETGRYQRRDLRADE